VREEEADLRTGGRVGVITYRERQWRAIVQEELCARRDSLEQSVTGHAPVKTTGSLTGHDVDGLSLNKSQARKAFRNSEQTWTLDLTATEKRTVAKSIVLFRNDTQTRSRRAKIKMPQITTVGRQVAVDLSQSFQEMGMLLLTWPHGQQLSRRWTTNQGTRYSPGPVDKLGGWDAVGRSSIEHHVFFGYAAFPMDVAGQKPEP